MKRWRVYFRNTLGIPSPSDSFLEIEGDLLVEGGVLVFTTPAPDQADGFAFRRPPDIFRVIKDYADCFAINADGDPVRPA